MATGEYLFQSWVESASATRLHQDVWVIAIRGGLPGRLLGEARRLADDMGCRVHAVGEAEHARAAITLGADLYHAAPALDSPEPALAALLSLLRSAAGGIFLFPAGSLEDEVAARLAESLQAGLVLGCAALRLEADRDRLVASCPVYGGRYFLDRACLTPLQILTLLPEAFPPAFPDESRQGQVIALESEALPQGKVSVLGATSYRPAPLPLHKAKRIVAVGRAGVDEQAAGLARQIASRLDAHFAGDRSAFDTGLISREEIIGLVGTPVAPELCLAVGIWGDILFTGGVLGTPRLIAVHPDPRAPILKVAETGVAADPKTLLPRLLAALG